jgi:hypothetical protein
MGTAECGHGGSVMRTFPATSPRSGPAPRCEPSPAPPTRYRHSTSAAPRPRQDRRWNAYTGDERQHVARLISLELVDDTGGQLQLSTETMANLGCGTEEQMATSTEISMTKPLKSQ